LTTAVKQDPLPSQKHNAIQSTDIDSTRLLRGDQNLKKRTRCSDDVSQLAFNFYTGSDDPSGILIRLQDMQTGQLFWDNLEFGDSYEYYSETVNINANHCHQFQITDNHGNGLCCCASFKLILDSEEVFFLDDNFGNIAQTELGNTEVTCDSEDLPTSIRNSED